MTRVRLIFAGFGGVGQALATRLIARRTELRKRIGEVLVVGIADSRGSVSDAKGLDLAKALALKRNRGAVGEPGTPDALELISSVDADILVEVAPAGTQGLSRVNKAFDSGMHVVTANKMPLAKSYRLITGRAKARGVALRFGACVGGGLPMLELGEACASADKVKSIEGILNTTSNYILTKMEEGGTTLERALSEAQGAGYAERDPSFDLRGIDAASKLVILANFIQGASIGLDDVSVEGIEGLGPSRMGSARARKKKLRMVARTGGSPQIRLAELPESDPLAVDGAACSVRFRCEGSGNRVLTGPSGGGAATSAAVLRDIVAVGEQLLTC